MLDFFIRSRKVSTTLLCWQKSGWWSLWRAAGTWREAGDSLKMKVQVLDLHQDAGYKRRSTCKNPSSCGLFVCALFCLYVNTKFKRKYSCGSCMGKRCQRNETGDWLRGKLTHLGDRRWGLGLGYRAAGGKKLSKSFSPPPSPSSPLRSHYHLSPSNMSFNLHVSPPCTPLSFYGCGERLSAEWSSPT